MQCVENRVAGDQTLDFIFCQEVVGRPVRTLPFRYNGASSWISEVAGVRLICGTWTSPRTMTINHKKNINININYYNYYHHYNYY